MSALRRGGSVWAHGEKGRSSSLSKGWDWGRRTKRSSLLLGFSVDPAVSFPAGGVSMSGSQVAKKLHFFPFPPVCLAAEFELLSHTACSPVTATVTGCFLPLGLCWRRDLQSYKGSPQWGSVHPQAEDIVHTDGLCSVQALYSECFQVCPW